MKRVIKKYLILAEFVLLPFICLSAWLFKSIRKAGLSNLPLSKKILLKIGVYPLIDHYYQPQFNFEQLLLEQNSERTLPSIDWNINEQLELLDSMKHFKELTEIPKEKHNELEFYLNNGTFDSGDAEYWYQIIRLKKPKRIIEIGSGNSTLMAIKAINKNKQEDSSYDCWHVCIEPYEMPWLEKTDATVIRSKVEDVDLSFFSQLGANDILFIDSSHVIRPDGDVLYEYLQLLPTLNEGVIVHVHDIFSPNNYVNMSFNDDTIFWNEQYLLEAFLSNNNDWKVIGALNLLQHKYHD